MKLHILGICGTFMGGIAALARELGHDVSGSDANVYPPMSSQLEALGIALSQGYAPAHIAAAAEQIVVGNALARGNPSVEAVLDAGRAYTSGAQWLAENVLPGRRTLAVAGTHGKTTTSSLLAFILEYAGRDPGFLIGGVPENFGVSARIGSGREFVVEADEYDTAFFDKRSKFVHYRPWLAILNNLEYDHADIFPDVAAIQRQFHHLLRTVPGNGRLIVNGDDDNLAQVLAMGCWTPVETFGEREDADWRAQLDAADGSAFTVLYRGAAVGEARWSLLGRHNVMNALAAIAAAQAVGVAIADAVAALAEFKGLARRFDIVGTSPSGVTVIDDFGHNPEKAAATLRTLKSHPGRVLAFFQPHGYGPLKQMGAELAETFARELGPEDITLLCDPVYFGGTVDRSEGSERIVDLIAKHGGKALCINTREGCGDWLVANAQPGDRIAVMGARDDTLSVFARDVLERLG